MKIAIVCSEPVDYTIAFTNGLAAHAEVTAFLPRSRYESLLRWFDRRVTVVLMDWPRTRSLSNPLFLWNLTRRIRALGPDVVHVLSNTTLWLNAAVPFWKPALVVTTVHDVTIHPGDRDTARLPGWGARLMARQSDHLVVHGKGLRRAAVRTFGKSDDTVHVLPHPAIERYAEDARARRLERTGPEDEVRILLFGRIFAYKGLATLLRAEAMFCDCLDNLRIVIAGRGDDPYDLGHLMGRRTRYDIRRGFIEDADVAQLFTDSDIVVLPYDEASQSGVLNVATTFGKPVVVTDVGELRATVEPNGIGAVVPPRAPGALARALRDLAESPSERERLGRNALAWARGPIAPETVGRRAVALYGRLLDRRVLGRSGVQAQPK